MSEPAPPSDAPRCLACGSTDARPHDRSWDLEYRTSPERFDFLRCDACGVVFIDPVPSDRLAEIYPDNYYAYASDAESVPERVKRWLDRRRYRKLLRALPGDALSVLDVGGGDGIQLDLAREADPRVSFSQLVDLDPRAVERARDRGHAAHCGPVEGFASQRRFDLVILLNLIEHVADPGALLRKVRGLLSERGRILIQTPNTDSLDARWFRHADWGGYHCPRHWALFDRDGFTRLAHASDLSVAAFGYSQGAPFWALSLLFWLERRGWVAIDARRPAMSHPLYPPLAAVFAGFDLVRARLGGRPSQMVFELAAQPLDRPAPNSREKVSA
ncbi:MAG: class I SAM-dependent methyltransferase [Myxococcales bacterium]|nr:class I SAM-dependent methyltransferase [Myxococcales bacterium]